MQNALELKNVTKKYDRFTLDNVSFELPTGCIMGLIGENGAGKSTIIKAIMDLINFDFGQISIMGTDNKQNFREMRENIGVVMDESCFPENLSYGNINLILKHMYKTWDEEKFMGLMKRFDLPPKKAVKTYSRGMKMKLSIAVSLSHASKLLILDEATSGLDPIVRDEILDVFLDFIQNEENSVLISSHITSDLEKICDYITFIHEGKIILSENKDELLEGYGILKCSNEELEYIAQEAIVGVRRNKFGAEALVKRDMVRGEFVIDNASLEDIMLYYIKSDEVKLQRGGDRA